MSAVTELSKANDVEITVAVGESRKSSRWENTTIKWYQLVDRLSKVKRTKETVDHYKQMSKDESADVKDVGGFVGGKVSNESRRGDSILYRSIITLDADYVKDVDSFIKKVEASGYEAVIHSTHSHTPERPRLRLLIPVRDEGTVQSKYGAISRYLSDEIGISFFDAASFKISQLMYWPSCPKDGEYIFKHIEGRMIKTDKFLENYPLWRDVNSLPGVDSDQVARSISKLSDPRKKNGLIGTFCDVYNVEEAIDEFLSDYYVQGESSNRYTYTGGESSNGLVIYSNHSESDFAFSHHDSDPANDGHAKNSFDLVRIHLYGHLDEEIDEKVPMNKRPSYTKMLERASEDPGCKRKMMESIFGELEEEKEDRLDLDFDEKESVRKTVKNFYTIIMYDPDLEGKIKFNEFSRKPVAEEGLPWPTDDYGEGLNDTDLAFLRSFIEDKYRIDSPSKLGEAFLMVLRKMSTHPLRDRLKGLEWDGVERIDSLLVDLFDSDDNPYTRTATRKWMTAAVARVMRPGVKFDHMLILVGDQGVGKSQFFYKLSLDPDYFTDSIVSLKHGKDAAELLGGKWIVELGELSAMRSADIENTKAFITSTHDTYRVPYSKLPMTFARQCVFGGTTNREDFLRDATGNRRFWPVVVRDTGGRMWDIMTEEYVEQLWAEAMVIYKSDEPLYFQREIDEDAIAGALEIQEHMTQADGRLGMVKEFLEKKFPLDWEDKKLEERNIFDIAFSEEGGVRRETMSSIELYVECFGKPASDYSKKETYQMTDLLREAGWVSAGTKKKKVPGHSRQRYFIRKNV